jgi:hypothetical protein
MQKVSAADAGTADQKTFFMIVYLFLTSNAQSLYLQTSDSHPLILRLTDASISKAFNSSD